MQLNDTLLEEALAEVDHGLARLEEMLWAAKASEQLLGAVARLERVRSRLHAVELEVAVEVDAGDHAKAAGAWQSTADYLTSVSGGRHGAGGRMLRTGRALCAERAATMAALRDGEVSPEQAEVVVQVINRLPVDAELRAVAEKLLLAEAAHLNASELKVAGLALWELLDPEGFARSEEQKLSKHERSAHLGRFLKVVEDGLGGVVLEGRGTVEDAAVIKAALASMSAPTGKELEDTDPEHGTSGRDIRDHGACTRDALVDVAQKVLDAQVLPTDHGRKPRVVVTIDHADLRDEVGFGTLETGERLSAAAVRRLACDSEIIPMVLGGDGLVIDVGRAQHSATGPTWAALVQRDRHCRFPGCKRPPIACDAHHIRHWANGGRTDLINLVLLCGAHHTIIHSTPWQVRINPHDGRPEFKPPTTRPWPTRTMLDQTEPVRPDHPDHPDHGWIRERRLRA